MDANEREFTGILGREVYEVIGCAFEVHNTHGHGLNEKVYENSLVVEFRIRSIPHDQQKRFTVLYKDEPVGNYIPDLIAHSGIVIDTKTIERITEHERGQVLNYLRITGLQVGIILNFKNPRLEWERIVLTSPSNEN